MNKSNNSLSNGFEKHIRLDCDVSESGLTYGDMVKSIVLPEGLNSFGETSANISYSYKILVKLDILAVEICLLFSVCTESFPDSIYNVNSKVMLILML